MTRIQKTWPTAAATLFVLAGACDPSGTPATDEPGGPPPALTLHSADASLEVRGQTPEEAYAYVSGLMEYMEFFRANGYDVALPDHPAFRPEAVPFGTQEVFAAEVYRSSDFHRAIGVLSADSALLQGALDWFAVAPAADGFRWFDDYTVQLTVYGPGGSYDAGSATIVMYTTPKGRFKGGGGAHTIVHEMMHIAVEDGLVQRYALSHWEKERLVDLLVQREFAHLLPDYRLQSQGVAALDPYVADVPLTELGPAVARYRSDHPVEGG